MGTRPARLRRLVLFALLATLLLGLIPATPATAIDDRTVGQIRTKLENKVNRARSRHGLRPVRVNAKVEHWAQDHARQMSRTRLFAHDPLLPAEVNRLKRTVWWYGENIASTSGGNAARWTHRAFMNSPGHRANILKPRATHMGIGVAKGGGAVWVVQRFVDLRP